jgi:DNA polymerase
VSRFCFVDLETFSRTLLKTAGVYRYVEDPSTEILIACYAFGDEPVNAWIPDPLLPRELQLLIARYVYEQGGLCHIGYKIPERLKWHASKGGFFVAHNAAFERVVLNGNPGQVIGFPHTQRSQWFCTMAKAAEAGLPHDLGGCAKALGTPHQKDENGRGDMLRLSKPRTPSKNNPLTRWLPTEVPDKFFNLYTYCIDDVLTERDIDVNVKDLTKKERKLYLLDQKINDRGWRVDTKAVSDVQFLIEDYKKKLVKKSVELCGLRPTQTQALSAWIRDQDVFIDNLQAQTVTDKLKEKDLPQQVKWVLRIYSLHNMKAVSKYTAMQKAMCADECLRGMFKFYGASTGRWSSRIVQLQNLFRPIIDDPELAIDAFSERQLAWIKTLYDKNPMKVFASCVRGMLVAREGRDLLFADYSSIEARIVAWLAGQLDMLEIFSTHGHFRLTVWPTNTPLRRCLDIRPIWRFSRPSKVNSRRSVFLARSLCWR